jgi:FKBP-type peptidyl-prolyl cis-trans isomerase
MIKSTLKFVAAIVLFASCNQFEKAPSGMLYKITHGSGNEKPLAQGQFLKLNIEYRLKSKDSLLQSNVGHIPAYLPIDTSRLRTSKYEFLEVVMKARKGDKIEFNLSLDTLVKMNAIQLNNIFKAGDVIVGKVEILNVFNQESLVAEDYKKEQLAETNREIKTIEDYLAKNKIKATKTPEGVFVVVKEPGDAAAKIDSTKEVSVFYKGFTLKGEVFDTNIKSRDSASKPYEVNLGTGTVIPGWEIGLKYFTKGAKGSLYVPAMLAYGPQANGPIKAYENLAFDIEIKDVNAKKPVAPMPNLMNGGQYGSNPQGQKK